MELRQVVQFVAVAELRSFRRAAERLHMAQPPLSQAIRRLEQDIGVTLFKRTSRSVDLTEAGKAFLVDARSILSAADSAVDAARRAAQGQIGRVRIGFTTPWAYDLVLSAVTAFRRRHDRVTLTLREEASSAQLGLLLDGVLDIAFVRLPQDYAVKGLVTLPLRHDALCVALPRGHPLASSRRLTLQRLQREPFVLPPTSTDQGGEEISLRAQISALCAESGFMPRVAQEARHMETIVRLVDAGLGVALVPSWTQRQWSTSVVYATLQTRSSLARMTLAAAWLRAAASSPTLDKFVATVRGMARPRRDAAHRHDE